MCGRLACGLQPEDICKSCNFTTPGNKTARKPQWQDLANGGKTYKPSYNICPTECAPVLLMGKHFDSDNRVVAPMVFGLIPPWVKECESNKYSTINCRMETMKTSKLYGNLVHKRQRCIVICYGFYEWQKDGTHKIPHFIHAKQPLGLVVNDPGTWNKGFKLLRMAALFDKHISSRDEEPVYSFTIITKEASSSISWLHTRMPLIAETDEQLSCWLDFEQFDTDEALQCFSLWDNFVSFPVSTLVNKTANKSISCIKNNLKDNTPLKRSKTETLLTDWLEKSKKKKTGDEEIVPAKLKKDI